MVIDLLLVIFSKVLLAKEGLQTDKLSVVIKPTNAKVGEEKVNFLVVIYRDRN